MNHKTFKYVSRMVKQIRNHKLIAKVIMNSASEGQRKRQNFFRNKCP